MVPTGPGQDVEGRASVVLLLLLGGVLHVLGHVLDLGRRVLGGVRYLVGGILGGFSGGVLGFLGLLGGGLGHAGLLTRRSHGIVPVLLGPRVVNGLGAAPDQHTGAGHRASDQNPAERAAPLRSALGLGGLLLLLQRLFCLSDRGVHPGLGAVGAHLGGLGRILQRHDDFG